MSDIGTTANGAGAGNVSEHTREGLHRIRGELSRYVVGQEKLVERLLVALLVSGHVLLEGLPGLAKTRTLSVLSRAVSGVMSRVQFTPDLLPSDLIGTEVFRPQRGEFEIRTGPLFANFVLADEINRAPAKVQSALLQAMQERAVTIAHQTLPLPDPFLVLATQNPIDHEGTYPLPEAQLDRFMMKIAVSYPSFQDEVAILTNFAGEQGGEGAGAPVLDLHELAAMKREVGAVHVDGAIDRYIATVVRATRDPKTVGWSESVDWGSSPRGGLALKVGAKALAVLRGRLFVVPDDVRDLAPDVLRHRVMPSYEAQSRGVTSDALVSGVISRITAPA